MPDLEALQSFQWTRQPGAERLVKRLLEEFLARNSSAAALARRMTAETGTRFLDWVEAIFPHPTKELEEELAACGFVPDPTAADGHLYRNTDGIFPAIVLDTRALPVCVYLKVDSVADFLAVNQLDNPITGEPFAPFRQALVATENETWLYVAERRGHANFEFQHSDPEKRLVAAEFLEQCRRRRRNYEHDQEGFLHAHRLIDAAIPEIGVDQTCALFFQAEREFWQSRNHAAQIQKARQDRLGLGWGNHDHHTYRSSRACFSQLIALFEKLGLTCRERFYAGREAGWGAQVMENLRANIVVFADVDLAPDELLADFSHHPLTPRDTLGTVGLWCGLHGEALLEAGMHHLECQFDFAALKEQLERHHIAVMKPFTDFPYLRQAFTEGQRWPVAEARLRRLLTQRLITPEQAEGFRKNGAIGSHLENLQRDEGYKGFNQKGVSEIISATDPRLHQAGVGGNDE
jgi:hypothetical protein